MLERYTRALVQEIENRAIHFPSASIGSIYFGGGTPSLLSSSQIDRILSSLHSAFLVSKGAEITLEANPATIGPAKLEGMMEAGINRLSLGVQSFNDDELRLLGRVHSRLEVVDTLKLLQGIGWKNYNIDLIYGLPGQSIERWIKNLEQAVEYSPRHLSIYLLQLDPSTIMGRAVEEKRLCLLDEDREAEMYYAGIDYLCSQGYRQYEISNFSVPGGECRHNLYYWQAEEYIGIGAGAVSFTGGRRYRNRPDVNLYLNCWERGQDYPAEELEVMTGRERMVDALILGLRLVQGIDLALFAKRFGVDLILEYHDDITACQDMGLLEVKQGRLILTRSGYFLSNEVLCRFMA